MSPEEMVTRREFLEYTQKTEESFQRVWLAIGELVAAQKRTEQRVEELADAQNRTEKAVQQLTQRVDSLAERQEQTERSLQQLIQRVDSLAERQEQTERSLQQLIQRVDALAERQEQTERSLQQLIQRVDSLSAQIGGLSNTVGYGLEDQSYRVLGKVIKRDFDIDVGRLIRKHIVYGRNEFDEVNIYGEARKDGEQLYIIGECKAQFGPNDVDRYAGLLRRVERHLDGQIVALAVSYSFHPVAVEKLDAQGIKHYWSYELSEE